MSTEHNITPSISEDVTLPEEKKEQALGSRMDSSTQSEEQRATASPNEAGRPFEMPSCPYSPDCPCFGPEFAGACICTDTERILRIWSGKGKARLMTDAQREWCLIEIDAVEGNSRSDFIGADDSAIASGVLNAWRDYCRDKGIY